MNNERLSLAGLGPEKPEWLVRVSQSVGVEVCRGQIKQCCMGCGSRPGEKGIEF